MTKHDLVVRVANETGLSQRQVGMVLDVLGHEIMKALDQRIKTPLPGVGVFTCFQSRERTGRNPTNGQPITIPATWRVRFKPTQRLKELVNLPF